MPTPLQQIKNYFTKPSQGGGTQKQGKSANSYITPIQLARLRTDIARWRDCMREAEMAYFPFRIKMQQMYIDTILNGHTRACWEKRKRLTKLRKFQICKPDGTPDEDLTKLFNKQWFKDFISFSLDARAYGYSLIYLGDLIDSEFVGTSIIRRWNVSPDRLNVTSFPYTYSGLQFLEPGEIKDWHIWVPTVSESGSTTCGMGIFYEVAIFEIYLRNVLGFNVDYAQNYGQPIRVGKTTKTDEDERAVLFQSLLDMGNNAAVLLDPTDEIDLIESKSAGQGYKVFESLEQRCEKKISKIILGHADALDSTPGKLGSGQDGEKSPVAIALNEVQTEDGEFIEPLINKELIPRMQAMGFAIPLGYYGQFLNDEEDEEIVEKEDKANLQMATIAKTMKDAGLEMDAVYFTNRTGIPAKAVVVPAPIVPGKVPAFSQNIKNKLEKLYN